MSGDIACAMAHRQAPSVFKHYLAVSALLCDSAHMGKNHLIDEVRRNVAAIMDQKNIGAKPLARKAELGETVVRDLVKGHTKDVQLGTISAIAEALGVPITALLPLAESVTNLGPTLYVKGVVAAGVWVEATEWPEDDWQSFTGRSDVTAEAATRFGLRVEGRSMDEIYPPGTIVECISVFGRAEIAAGKRVVVIRQRDDQKFEATVKELVQDGDGKMWAVPRSSDPSFLPINLSDPEPGVIETRVAAIVVSSIRPE